jgi:hypothetical protein
VQDSLILERRGKGDKGKGTTIQSPFPPPRGKTLGSRLWVLVRVIIEGKEREGKSHPRLGVMDDG